MAEKLLVRYKGGLLELAEALQLRPGHCLTSTQVQSLTQLNNGTQFLYEAHGKADELKKDGEFQMLNVLMGNATSENKAQSLSRETKLAPREIQIDGNRSAHTRKYNAVKADVDKLRQGIWAVAENLLHHANLKQIVDAASRARHGYFIWATNQRST